MCLPSENIVHKVNGVAKLSPRDGVCNMPIASEDADLHNASKLMLKRCFSHKICTPIFITDRYTHKLKINANKLKKSRALWTFLLQQEKLKELVCKQP